MKNAVAVFSMLAMTAGVFGQVNNTSQLSGADALNTITTAVPFLMIAPDARGGGLAEVGAATSPDANSIHWNPAKLAFVDKKMGVSISYTPWLRALVPDINLAYISGYKQINKNQTFGMSLLYFSLGDITFTDIVGNTTGQFKPNEFAIDMAYSRKLSEDFSGGMALRYIYSNLTGGIQVESAQTHPGRSVAADVSAYYHHQLDAGGKKNVISAGIDISNIGSKISYTDAGTKDFIPTNLRLGACFKSDLDDYNSFSIAVDINKLLVPTPPIRDSVGGILLGKDPNVSPVTGIFQSFGDAPGGFKEELKEYNYSAGLEYWYDKQFAVRAGYFHEPTTKGNRKYFTLGAGLKYSVFGLDFAYLIPTEQRHPLENTLRFSLLFDFDSFKSQNKTN